MKKGTKINKNKVTISIELDSYTADYKAGDEIYFVTWSVAKKLPDIQMKKGVIQSIRYTQEVNENNDSNVYVFGDAIIENYDQAVSLSHIRATSEEIKALASSFLDENFEDLTAL